MKLNDKQKTSYEASTKNKIQKSRRKNQAIF